MTRVMYDALSTQAATIPADAQLVAGYIDAGPVPAAPPWGPAEWALFPNAVHVGIATQPTTNAGDVLDVEAGDASPEQAPGWVAMRRHAGASPSVYCSLSAWPAVRDQFAAQGVELPPFWIAAYADPPDPSMIPGAVAHQYGGNAAGQWDVSTVADYWPGVDPPPPPPPPPPAPPEGAAVIHTTVQGYDYLVWCSGGSVWARSWNNGAPQKGFVVAGGHNVGDPANPSLVLVEGGLGPVVYGVGPGGATLQIAWTAKLPDGTPLPGCTVLAP